MRPEPVQLNFRPVPWHEIVGHGIAKPCALGQDDSGARRCGTELRGAGHHWGNIPGAKCRGAGGQWGRRSWGRTLPGCAAPLYVSLRSFCCEATKPEVVR